MYRLNDNLLRLVGIPICMFTNTFVTRIWDPGLTVVPLERQLIFTLAETVIAWQLCRIVLVWSCERYPGIERLAIRVSIAFGLYLLLTTGVLLALLGIFHGSGWLALPALWPYFFKNLAISFGFIILLAPTYEAQYYFTQWLQTLHDNEHLKQDALRAKLDALKMQIKPEFLFSSLDTITRQIKRRDEGTARLVDNMSDMYRYILQSRNHSLVSLERELEFLQTYFQLLKPQYGDAVALRVALPHDFLGKQIPPLTLQILVEKLLKANLISAEKPLKINIFVESEAALALHAQYASMLSSTSETHQVLNVPGEQIRFPGHPEPLVQQMGSGVKVVLAVHD